MACKPCQEKALQREKEKMAAAAANRPASVGTTSTYVQNAKDMTKGCMIKYDMLKNLERKIIEVYKVTKTLSGIGYRMLESQRKVRSWIVDLSYRCPNEEELEEMVNFVNNEYAERIEHR